MNKVILGVLVLSIILSASMAIAQEKGTKEECVTLVKQAIEMAKKQGEEATFKEIMNSNGRFLVKDLYLYVADTTGVCYAHGVLPVMVGKNMLNLKDKDGKNFTQEMINLVLKNNSGWVDYSWTNPKSGKIAPKTAYGEKWISPKGIQYGFVCGVYK